MTIQEKIAVMQAYADGKEVEMLCCIEGETKHWATIDNPSWNWKAIEYRIKPEPKFRPYKDSNEFFKAQREHGMYLQKKDKTVGYFPIRVSDVCVTWYTATATNNVYYDFLLKEYQWQDGSPCGILEE